MISACNDILISWQDTPSFSASIFFYFDGNLGEVLLQIVLGEFLAAEILRSRRDPGENLGELLAGEISRSRRDLVEISTRISARISASFWTARSRDLAGISPRSRRDLEISPAKNSPRFSPRSRSKFCRGAARTLFFI